MMSNKCEHTEGAAHDCEYVDWRNAKIPQAETLVIRLIGKRPKDVSAGLKWDLLFGPKFLIAMDAMCSAPAKKKKVA